MKIALVRHPRAAIAPGLCYGRLDLALHADGLAAIGDMVAALGELNIGTIWTSPAQRCHIVADAIRATLGGSVRADPRLLELDFGAWEGQGWDQVPRDALDRWAADPLGFAPPEGESGAALVARLRSFHQDLVQVTGDSVVVSHGGPLKVLLALLRHRPIDLFAPPPPLGNVQILPTVPPDAEGA